MQRERDKRSWEDNKPNYTQSYHGDGLVRHDVRARQNAAVKQYKAALDALFEKKSEPEPVVVKAVENPLPRIIDATAKPASGSNKRQDLLKKIRDAQGSKAVSDAIENFLTAGYELPDDQETYLQMLEHRNESRILTAIEQLTLLLAGQLPKRKPVLVQRLKRIEENAEDAATREAAAKLRQSVG